MRYRVRNEHGEVSFDNFLELERAYRQGLVEPDDQVLEGEGTVWRKAGAMPLLVNARRAQRRTAMGDQVLWMVATLVVAGLALYQLVRGHFAWGMGLAVVVSLLLWQITTSQAFKK